MLRGQLLLGRSTISPIILQPRKEIIWHWNKLFKVPSHRFYKHQADLYHSTILQAFVFRFQKLSWCRSLRRYWSCQRATNRRDRLTSQHPFFPHIQNIAGFLLELPLTKLPISSAAPQLEADVIVNGFRPRILLTARVPEH